MSAIPEAKLAAKVKQVEYIMFGSWGCVHHSNIISLVNAHVLILLPHTNISMLSDHYSSGGAVAS
jgi:hypothetical protein